MSTGVGTPGSLAPPVARTWRLQRPQGARLFSENPKPALKWGVCRSYSATRACCSVAGLSSQRVLFPLPPFLLLTPPAVP